MSEALVRLDGVSKRFEGVTRPAIAAMTTTIMGGGITGLAGPDGAGKTTLLRLILGLLKPDSGMLRVCGRDPIAEASEVRDLVAYMPQRFGLYEDLTVLENLTLYADLRAVTGEERRAAFDRLLAFTSLAPFTGRLAGALSGGMKQKLGLACALIRTPRLLLLDEPSAGVDPVSRRELWRMVRTLTGQGIGVVWSTAYLDEAERCERVLLLSDGKLIYEGSPSELTNRMSGRSFHVRNAGERRRAVLASAAKMPGIIDGIIQGANVRIVLAAGAAPPLADDFKGVTEVEVVSVAPRFEDAFVSLLGSARPAVSRLAVTTGRRHAGCGAHGRGQGADPPLRLLYGGRPDLVLDRRGRDLRSARAERCRQIDDIQDALRPAAPDLRRSPRRGPRRRAADLGRAEPAWLHGAEVLALW